jgi:hypothetical protein
MAIINPYLNTTKPKLLLNALGIVAFSCGLCLTNVSTAAEPSPTHSATLAWDPVPESVLMGHRVLIGTSSGQYTATHEVGLTPQLTLGGLEFGQTYYAVVISLGNDGLESEPSSELVFTVAPPPLPSATQVAIDGSGQVVLQWSFSKAALGSSPEFVIQASPDLSQWAEVETVSADQPAAEEGGMVKFVRPIAAAGPQMFYRLTARNWMGESTGP